MATLPESDSQAGLIDGVPQPARDGFMALVGYNFQPHDYRRLHDGAMQIVGQPCTACDSPDACWQHLGQTVADCPWQRFYGLVEMVSNSFTSHTDAYAFQNKVNDLFGQHRLAYQLANGKVERIGS